MSRPDQVTAPIPAALARLEEETAQVRAEQQTFEQFAERVAALVVQPRQHALQPVMTPRSTHSATAMTTDVCRIYRDTVMALAHYDNVYGDTLTNSLTVEFGPEIATVLSEATPLTASLQTCIRAAARQAASERAMFLERLTAERGALEAAQETLATLAQQRTDDAVTRETLDRRCEHLARDRQRQLQTRSLPTHLDGHDVATYLYQELEWTYPILAAVALLSDRLRSSGDASSRANA